MTCAAMRLAAPIGPIMDAPRAGARQLTQALFGETLDVLAGQGAWRQVRLRRDGYEGFMRASLLVEDDGRAATHTPCLPQTLIFPAPDIKAAPARPLYMGAQVRIRQWTGRFAHLAGGGHVPRHHLRRLDEPQHGPVEIARMFLHAPYLWGGCSSAGIDCSGLVQMALRMAGHETVPRDSGDQARTLGAPLPVSLARGGRLRAGDLIFWTGHVAMMVDETRIIHANAHHMRVAIEPLKEALGRIEAGGGGPVTAIRRI